jgi:peroxiredoxin
LSDQKPKHFTMLAFYRGLHCGACRDNLERLQSMHLTFSRLGVTAIAVSMDNAERASATEAEWDLTNLCVAYGLSLAQAKQWGLYVSRGRGRTSAGLEEPPLFVEPGLFLVRPDMTLYCACVQSMPLVRFSFEDVLDTLSAIIADSVPARGEVAD